MSIKDYFGHKHVIGKIYQIQFTYEFIFQYENFSEMQVNYD